MPAKSSVKSAKSLNKSNIFSHSQVFLMNKSADAAANITLRQMRAFIMVADTGGFAAASHRLHLTPSALSLLIKEMETLLGVRLFDRTTRSTVLSQAGMEFYPLAKKVLDDL